MIHGAVTREREAIIDVAVRGPQGQMATTAAVIDTGFNGFLVLPPSLVARLGLAFVGMTAATLGDGQDVQFPLFAASVVWDGTLREADVLEADGDSLVGMALLDGFDLHIQVIEGGHVTIERLR